MESGYHGGRPRLSDEDVCKMVALHDPVRHGFSMEDPLEGGFEPKPACWSHDVIMEHIFLVVLDKNVIQERHCMDWRPVHLRSLPLCVACSLSQWWIWCQLRHTSTLDVWISFKSAKSTFDFPLKHILLGGNDWKFFLFCLVNSRLIHSCLFHIQITCST